VADRTIGTIIENAQMLELGGLMQHLLGILGGLPGTL
jgi:hypothetical protein